MMPTLLQQTEIQPQKVVKVTKVRRTRQPRNPQLSVARRNERERNRVKMVNNGFALLREHLPVEDLQACEQSGSETPTPDGGSVSGQKSGKAKKYSKVETLRAAIQRIRMLEELIRSTEPGFESINITSSVSMLSAYDEEPLSVCEPLSCASSSHSNQSNSLSQEPIRTSAGQLLYAANITSQSSQEQCFVKLEPQQQQMNMPSPQHSQASHASSSLNNNHHQTTQQQSYQPASTQVHLTHLNHRQQTMSLLPQQQQQQQPQQQQQQQQHQPMPSHTHIWIQQHQNSFIEQQQYQQPQQTGAWLAQQQQQYIEATSQKESNWFIQQTPESPDQQQQQHIQQQQQHIGQQQPLAQVESPVWLNSSPVSVAQSTSSQPISFGHHHHQQQHQISLYSQ